MSESGFHAPKPVQHRNWITATALLVSILGAFFTAPLAAGPGVAGDTIADLELGQFDFVHSTQGFVRPQSLNLNNLTTGNGVAIDQSTGHLYVVDPANSRVLGWTSAASFKNGDRAAIEIGQPDFYTRGCKGAPFLCNPTGLTVDRLGNLYVSDWGQGLVWQFLTPFSQKPPIAGTAVANGGLYFFGVAVDTAGNLYVADRNSSRILEYKFPLNHPSTPNVVYGQPTLTANACNRGNASPSAITLCTPYGIALDKSNNLYVADFGNHRALRYSAGSTTASLVFGQSTFSGHTPGTTATTLNQPSGVTVDINGNLYVADSANHRVTEYDPPFNNGKAANLVIGQDSATAAEGCNEGQAVALADTLCFPTAVATDSTGNLYVHDSGNNRILEYNEGHTPLNMTTNRELGQHDFWHNTSNFVDLTTMNPVAVTVDRHSVPQHLYVLDGANNRVLGYNDARTFANGGPANLVLGQFDFWNNYHICNFASANTLCLNSNTGAIAVDSQGNVWVTDSGYRRVLGYSAPFKTGLLANQAASWVLGPPDFETILGGIGCNASATNVCGAVGLAFDSNDNLYVTDGDNSRVLEFTQPRSYKGILPQPANLVFGQGATGKSFTLGGCNQGGSVTATTLCGPGSVALDSLNNLYVADAGNNRVLRYNTPLNAASGEPGAGGVTADLVFGQAGKFTTKLCNGSTGSVGALTLCGPSSVSVDPFSNLFVCDTANNRVLEYREASNPSNVTPIGEFGQGTTGLDFTHNGNNAGGLSANSLSLVGTEAGVATDLNGDLYVADGGNIRLLLYLGRF